MSSRQEACPEDTVPVLDGTTGCSVGNIQNRKRPCSDAEAKESENQLLLQHDGASMARYPN